MSTPRSILLLETNLVSISIIAHLVSLRSPTTSAPLYKVSAVTDGGFETVAALERLGVRAIRVPAGHEDEVLQCEVASTEVVINTSTSVEVLRAVLKGIVEREDKSQPIVYVHAATPPPPRSPHSPIPHLPRTPSSSSNSSSSSLCSLPSPTSEVPPPTPSTSYRSFSSTLSTPSSTLDSDALLQSFALRPSFSSLNAHIALLSDSSHPPSSPSVGIGRGPFNRLALQVPNIIRSALTPTHASPSDLQTEAHPSELVAAYDLIREALERDGSLVGPAATARVKLALARQRRAMAAMKTGRRVSSEGTGAVMGSGKTLRRVGTFAEMGLTSPRLVQG